MATYVNDLRLKEIATGDESGTWGTSTNTNLELIGEAFSFGTEAITTNADTHTTTIADGSTDPGRSMYLKYTGTLDSACTITIGPNTVSKMWFIENGTSGSQNIIISQGSGANITIPPGDTKAIYSDGAGSGAAMVDAFASLSVVDLKVQDDLTVTDDMTVGGTLGVTGVFTGTSLDISGDIDVDGTTNLDVVDIDGAVNMASTLAVTGAITGATAAFTQSNTVNSPVSARFNGSNKKIAFNINNTNGQGFISSNSNSVAGSANQTYDITNTSGKIDFGAGITIDTAVSGSAGGTITYVNNADFLPTGIVFNEGGADLDFRVESNNLANALFINGADGKVTMQGATTTIGSAASSTNVEFNINGVASKATRIQFQEGGANKWLLGQGAASETTAFELFNAGGTIALSVDRSSNVATFAAGIAVTAGDLVIPGSIIHAGDTDTKLDFNQADTMRLITGDTTAWICNGSSMVVNEDSADFDFRVESNGNTHMLFVDGGNNHVNVGVNTDYGGTLNVATTDTSVNLVLASEDAGAANAPILDFHRNSASPANNDGTGHIRFRAENSTDEAITYAEILTVSADVTNASEDSIMYIQGMKAGTVREKISMHPTETVFNDNGVDLDFRIESDGNVNMFFVDAGNDRIGIGRSDPTQILEVHKATGGDQTVAKFSAHNYGDTGKTYVEIGTENGDGSSRIGSFNDTGNKSVLVFENHGAGSGAFNETMRIDSLGRMIIGHTAAVGGHNELLGIDCDQASAFGIFVSGDSSTGGSSNVTAMRFFDSGSSSGVVGSIIFNDTATAFNTSSDYRLKENVTYSWDATTRLKQLKPARFNFIKNKDKTIDGFLAHEVSSIVPGAVFGEKDAVDKDGNAEYQAIDHSKLVPLLIKTIQELEERITTLES